MLEADGRHEQAERRSRPRCGRNDHLLDAEDPGHPGHVGGAGAPHADDAVAAGVAALLDDVAAGGGGHVLADDLVDAPGRLHGGQAEGAGDTVDGPPGGVLVEGHAPAQEEVRVQVAQQQVGVGHRGFGTAEAVAGGPRVGAGAARSHLQEAQLVDPGDAAAPGADLDHVDDRSLDGQPAAPLEPVDPGGLHARRDVRLAVLDQAGLGGGAAHVEGDDVVVADPAAEMGAGQGAAGGPGLQEPDGEADRHLRRHQAAGGLGEVEPAPEAATFEGRDEAAHVAGHQGLDVGVGGGGRGALVFAELRVHLRGEGDGKVRVAGGDQIAGPTLVGGVLVGVQVADGHGLDPAGDQAVRLAAHLVLVEGHDGLAVTAHALVDLAAPGPGHQGIGELKEQVVLVVALLVAHLQHVPEAPGGQQGQGRPAAFDDGVGHQGGAVHQVGDVGQREVALGEQGLQALDGADGGIVGGGQALVQAHLPRSPVHQDEVREGAADVQADAIAIRSVRHAPCLPCRGSRCQGNDSTDWRERQGGAAGGAHRPPSPSRGTAWSRT